LIAVKEIVIHLLTRIYLKASNRREYGDIKVRQIAQGWITPNFISASRGIANIWIVESFSSGPNGEGVAYNLSAESIYPIVRFTGTGEDYLS